MREGKERKTMILGFVEKKKTTRLCTSRGSVFKQQGSYIYRYTFNYPLIFLEPRKRFVFYVLNGAYLYLCPLFDKIEANDRLWTGVIKHGPDECARRRLDRFLERGGSWKKTSRRQDSRLPRAPVASLVFFPSSPQI